MMSKIVDATKNLPKDPGHALATFADRAINIFRIASHINIDDAEFIITFVGKFSTRLTIDVNFKIRASESRRDFAFRILKELDGDLKPKLLTNSISSEVDDIINEFLDEQDESFSLARLNEEERTKVHIQINNVREIIASSVLSDRKKNALYERLNPLACEVDAHGTRTERFFAFMGDVAFVMGDMAEKAKPLLDEVNQMMRILARSRARQEASLCRPETMLFFCRSPATKSRRGLECR